MRREPDQTSAIDFGIAHPALAATRRISWNSARPVARIERSEIRGSHRRMVYGGAIRFAIAPYELHVPQPRMKKPTEIGGLSIHVLP
jgi:hypothetical protein